MKKETKYVQQFTKQPTVEQMRHMLTDLPGAAAVFIQGFANNGSGAVIVKLEEPVLSSQDEDSTECPRCTYPAHKGRCPDGGHR